MMTEASVAAPTLAQRLKSDTHLAHAALEKAMMGHLRVSTTPGRYAQLLSLMHAWLAPLGEKISAALGEARVPDATRRTASWLEEDLADLPPTEAVKPAADADLPAINSAADAYGALYVLEGSTLGGQVVAGILRKITGLPDLPLRYFLSYGDETRARWETFRADLNAFAATDPAHEDAIVASADATFDAFRRWFVRHSESAA